MAAIPYTRATTTTITASEEHDEPEFRPQEFRSSVRMVGTGMRQLAQSTTEVLVEFQGAMKIIQPLLSPEHQKQVYDTFAEYHLLLMTSQRFLTRSLILAARARTDRELVASIDVGKIQDMCSIIQRLIQQFLDLNPILEEKLKDQRALKLWRNIFGLIAATGCCALLVGSGVGIFSSSGFTKDLKVFLITTGAVTVAAGAPAVFAHVAQHVSELDHINMVLKDIRGALIQMSQNYPKIEEMAQVLSDDDNTKREFIQLLKETQAEVDKGFALLKQL
jgi:hypothetical protein